MMILKNKYGEFRSGWVITAAIMLILIGMLVSASLVPEDLGEPNMMLKILVTLIYSVITIGGGIWVFKLFYKRSLRQLGIIPERWFPEFLHGVVIGTVSIGLVFVVLLLLGQAEVSRINISKLFSGAFLVEAFSLLLYVFAEEILTRGLFMTALKTTRNKLVIFVSSALLFTLFHLINPGVTVLSMLNTFLFGLLFAYMFIKSGKLWLPTGFHFAWNFLQGDIFGLTTSGSEQMAVFDTVVGSNQIIAGGSYGPEGGIIVTIVGLLGFAYIYLFVKTPKEGAWTMTSGLPLTWGE